MLTAVLKAVFGRVRSPSYSFPSGHATVAVGFYGTLTLILAYRLGGSRGGPW